MLTIAEGLLDETLRTLHRCGAERRECVALWTGPIDLDGKIDAVLHPPHDSDARGYRIPPEWMHQLSLDLLHERRCVRAQIHTHPGAPFHSRSDDTYPAVATPGFLSLVVANFARPPVALDAVHASVLTEQGWRRSRLLDEVEVNGG